MIRQIKWRLTATYLIVIFVSMSILGAVLSYSVERQFVSEVQAALNSHGQLLRSHMEANFQREARDGHIAEICRLMGSKIHARVVVYDTQGRILADSERSPGALAVDRYIPESMRGLRQGFGCRICHSEVRNPRNITVSVPIAEGGRIIGKVKLSASLYEAQRAAAKTRRIILTTLIITSLIAAAISMRIAASIAEPISHMNAMAHKMAAGDLHQQVHVNARDEVGELAESLNVMAGRLRSNLDQLAQERDKMETILRTMADGIVVTNRSGSIVLFNRAAERLFGLSSQQVMGEQVELLTAVSAVPEMIRRTLAGGSPMRRDVRADLPAKRVVGVYAAPVRDQHGEIAGGVAVLQDITEARRQAEIRKDFVANVSHELRTPVASVRAIVGALQSGALDDPDAAERFLDGLDAETERLSLLLNDLLNLSALESGKQELHRTEILLREVAEQVVSALADKARQYGVEVSVDIPQRVTAFVDETQMEQVLLNLIDNAIKYTGEGGSVHISARDTDAEIMLMVKDTGIGIPPADLDRIFERFYRVDKARSRRLGGTGLGLSIVKDIVDAHGGRVAVESEVGHGSTFTIILPRVGPHEMA